MSSGRTARLTRVAGAGRSPLRGRLAWAAGERRGRGGPESGRASRACSSGRRLLVGSSSIRSGGSCTSGRGPGGFRPGRPRRQGSSDVFWYSSCDEQPADPCRWKACCQHRAHRSEMRPRRQHVIDNGDERGFRNRQGFVDVVLVLDL